MPPSFPNISSRLSASLAHLPQLDISSLQHPLPHECSPSHPHVPPSSSHTSSQFSPPWTLLLPCPTPAGLSEQEPLHLHFSGHCLANGLLICSIVPCEANSISASQSSLPVDSVIDWRNSCHRPAACSLPPSLPVHPTPPHPSSSGRRPAPTAAVHPCHLPKDLSPAMKNDRNI